MNYTMKITGKQIPNGTIKVSGAKNSATRLLAASLLTDESVRITNFPTKLVDAVEKFKFIKQLGADLTINDYEDHIEVNAKTIDHSLISDYDLPIRTTYLLAGSQLVRNQKAVIPYPGGCKIGARGYDLHIMVWKALGCEVEEKEDYIYVVGKLKGGVIDFPISTVGGTENALICASVAEGMTEIHNAYITPEVEDLIRFLTKMGATIQSFGNSMVRVQGTNGLLRGTSYEVMPDRIEALTWLVFGALTGGRILVEGVPFETMQVPLLHLEDSGIDIFRNSSSALILPECLAGKQIQPFEVSCGTHPGVISDMQPFYTLLGMKAKGISRIFDYRYPARIAYAKELDKFTDGTIDAEHGKITTKGIASFTGAVVTSTDLRGSMALVMAAFCADGESTVHDVQMAMRGYNDLEHKLRELGLVFILEKS